MKHNGYPMIAAGAFLFVFMLTSLLMMSDALQNSDRFGELYSGLLIFNAIGLFILIILIGMNLRQLIHQLREKTPGARMTIRMVIMFSILSMTPLLILYYFSLDFLHRGIDSWFDLRVEHAFDNSLELGQLAIDMRMKELSKQTQQIANEFAEISNVVIPFEIDEYRSKSGAEELTLMSKQGVIIASSLSDTTSLVPDHPNETILYQLQQGNNYIGLDTLHDTGLTVRVVINVPEFGLENEPRILQALFPIPERINVLANDVQAAFIKYKELSYLREQLKFSFIVILTLVLLFSIFSVVWAAFYSARNLAAPIRDLVKGTKSVAEGDYNTRLPVPSHDELGFLVASFNEMTRRLSKARDELKHSQQQVETQHAYLETVLGRLSSGVLVLDQQKQLRTANISSGNILGIEVDSMVGKTLDDLKSEYRYLETLLQTIEFHLTQATNDWREQVTMFGVSGRQILMCSGTSLHLSQEKDSVYVIVFDDITALVQGQRDAAWSEMARRLAHEIKNPLTPIKLATERLRHKYLENLIIAEPDILDRLTNTIIQQVETMKDMVNTFSEYARVPIANKEYIDINLLIQEVVDLFSNLDANAKIHMNLGPELPKIKADSGRIRQVLNNLLDNAFDASSEQKQTSLTISTVHTCETGVDYIEIRIKDSGAGIKQDIISSIFEPYVTTKRKGTGLGLAIVKKIIEEHNGIVTLENNSNEKGACAVMRLPIAVENIDNVSTMNKDVI